jgi:hypothetical protein
VGLILSYLLLQHGQGDFSRKCVLFTPLFTPLRSETLHLLQCVGVEMELEYDEDVRELFQPLRGVRRPNENHKRKGYWQKDQLAYKKGEKTRFGTRGG